MPPLLTAQSGVGQAGGAQVLFRLRLVVGQVQRGGGRAGVGQVEVFQQNGSQMRQAIGIAQRFDEIEDEVRPVGGERFLDRFQIERAGEAARGVSQAVQALARRRRLARARRGRQANPIQRRRCEGSRFSFRGSKRFTCFRTSGDAYSTAGIAGLWIFWLR